jgi:large subunit ribosomal protein L7Ae
MVLPAIAQFNLDKNMASQLFMLLDKYCPEMKQEKKACLATVAQAAVGGSA